MKTLSLEMSKRLEKYLIWIETEYIYYKLFEEEKISICTSKLYNKENCVAYYKTLTLEESIEFLPKNIEWCNPIIRIEKEKENVDISYWNEDWETFYAWDTFSSTSYKRWESLLQAIEEMLNYLLTNNLLEKWKH